MPDISGVNKAALRLLKKIYNNGNIVLDANLLRQTAAVLLAGVGKGYGKKLETAYNAADKKAIENLTKNVYHFSAAKNYHELRDMTSAVKDGDRIRSFEEFRREAGKICDKYNGTWLRTEYNQAIAASQSAARWWEYKRNEKEMPYLQYHCVMDANTRPEHAVLHGIIKKIDDPFWTQYMPPNGYGCRCEAIQLPGSNYRETPDDRIHPPYVNPMFKVNFGQQGVAFPEKHPYFKRVPERYDKQVSEMARSEVRRILDNAEEYKRLKADNNYTDVQFEWTTGGLKATHIGHSFDKRTGDWEKDVQSVGFKAGNKVILGKEDQTVQHQRSTDGIWNGKEFEIAGCETGTKNNIRNALKHCASKRKTEIAVLYFPNKNFTREAFTDGLQAYNGLKKNNDGQWKRFKEIICISDGERLYRE